MADPHPSSTRTFKVHITPHFTEVGNISKVACLFITLSLESPGVGLQTGDTIASHSKPYKEVEVSDDKGTLETDWAQQDDLWNLILRPGVDGRATEGVVTIRYQVYPMTEKRSIAYPATQLLAEQGGVIGPGCAFILMPFRETHRHIIEWDLDAVPEGTRGVSSLGEGSMPRELSGDRSTLQNIVYMVGDIQSQPSTDETETYGYYWFGNLPSNIAKIRDIHAAFTQKVASFFSDPLTATRPYRTFIQNAAPAKGFGNTAFLRSNIFSYDEQIDSVQDYELVRCMAHEVVYNFLGPGHDTSSQSPNQIEDWLYKGIANALSIYLPFRPPMQFRDGKYFQATLNMLCMKYYTSPLIHASLSELLDQARTNEYAREQLHVRAWVFVVCTDFRARDLAGGIVGGVVQRPIEDRAIKVLAQKRARREPYGLQQWFELLQPLMGLECVDFYEKMSSGEIFIFPERAFGAKTHRMVERPREILDFGMERGSFEEGAVKGLKEGSRAQQAGLVEGDVIVDYSYPWRCVDNFEAKMQLSVQRQGGQEVRRIEYWPRSYKTATCWQLTEVAEIAIS